MLTLNAQANSFLFASGVNNTKIPPTAIIQNTCATHSGGGGAVSSAGTCDHYGSELIFYNDEINSISGLNISTDYQPSNNINTDKPDLPQSVTMSRDVETIYQFTNCGQTGRTGPSQSQTDNAYAGTTLDGLVTINTQGIQEWTIPISGNYSIHAYGGQGGIGGDGASIIGEFSFNAGDVILIVVGQMGSNQAGGGGTFIYNNTTSTFLLVAGGGGGGASNTENQGQATEDGMDGYESGNYSGVYAGKGGTNGGGGGAGSASDNCTSGGNGGDGADGGNTNGTSSNPGAGGAGIYGNGGSGYNGAVQGGRKWSGFMLGGSGNSDGGFGGGGAAYSGYGGGGGYSGGGGGAWNTGWSNAYGGGAGSFNAGTNQINTTGGNTGHGQVVITSYAASNTAPTATAQSVTSNEDSPQTITLTGSDVEGDALTYALATNPSNGTSTLSGSQVTYTPNTNYNGSDSFTFTVSDAEYTSSAATVSIIVASVNDLPIISSTPALDALDGSLYEYSISVNDIDGDVVAITATGPNWLTVNDNILSGTPSPSDGGLHQIVLSANDGNGGVVTQSYTLAVSLHSLVITGESGYRIFSSPVSGIIYGDLLDELWTQGAEGSDSPNSNPNIWTYGNGWNSVTDFSSDALTSGKGFLMYIFADIDFDGDDDLNDPENPVIISIDGAQQESGVSVVSEPSDWNLIGNPYGLSVDISQMLSDNNGTFNSTIYALDHTNPGYKTHNGVVGNIENDEIKPFDGFWIKADADGNVFEFTEQSILKGSLNNAGRTTTDDSNGSAVFTFTNGDYSSSTYLSFTPEGEINLDPADAYRLVPMSPAEHLTSMIHESGKSLSINNLPLDLSSDISFPMDVMMLSPTEDGYETQAEQVNLSWDVTNLPAGITLELNNNITGQNINLTGYPSANINLPSKGGFSTSGDFMATYPVVGQSQFTLSVYGTLAAVEDDVLPERLTLHSAYPNPFNPSTLIRFDLSNADMVSLDIFDIAGKQVASLISEYMIPGSHQINWNPGNLSSGLYLVNLVVGTETFNQKITFIK